MTGSSNFTRAGMGLSKNCNAEANVLTIADHLPNARLPGEIHKVWPDCTKIQELSQVEWQGATPELVEEQRAAALAVPAGFLSATYRAGDQRELLLRFDADRLPADWSLHSSGASPIEILCRQLWQDHGAPDVMLLPWKPLLPPEKILVRWVDQSEIEQEAFLPLNVEDANELPPPAELSGMSADDMLLILAASDPSAAFRVWARQRQQEETFDEDLDAATPPDLDPLRRYELKSTFLRRVRSRARVMARLRLNLQSPVWSRQALQWRLEGFIGIRPLAERVLGEVLDATKSADEALLTLSDLMILMREVTYEPVNGAIPKADFYGVYEPFLAELVEDMSAKVHSQRHSVGPDVLEFWDRVVQQCQN